MIDTIEKPNAGESLEGKGSERYIHFVQAAASGDRVLLEFRNPAPSVAVIRQSRADPASSSGRDHLTVLLLSPTGVIEGVPQALGEAPSLEEVPVHIKYRGVELWWRPGRAILQCDPGATDDLLPALAEFAHYERELRRIEDEIAVSWPDVEEDNPLAFDVTPASLRRSAIVGARMQAAFQRRIRLARIEPLLYAPHPSLPAPAQKLGEELREGARIEARTETASGQIEVFEHIYEMASQRMGEFRAARQAHIVELVIIVLLAAEALLMTAEIFWRMHR